MPFLPQWVEQFDHFINSLGVEDTTPWPLMNSGTKMLLICLSYLFTVMSFGPKLMESRKPFKLKQTIIIYNTFQVIACTTIFIWVLRVKPSFGCVSLSHTIAEEDYVTISNICWWNFTLKLADLVDTVFFVLRKKQNQVSALHIYHHTSTLLVMWGVTKFFPSRMALLPIMMNSFIHAVMYTYYLLSAVGPSVQDKINRWKKYITIIQMVQFCILVIYTSQILSPSCDVPKFYACIFIPNVFLVFYMFYQFYQEAYHKRKQKIE